jgi:transposase
MTRARAGGRWRALDLGTVKTFLEADSPRVRCAEHGVVAAQVPWARQTLEKFFDRLGAHRCAAITLVSDRTGQFTNDGIRHPRHA